LLNSPQGEKARSYLHTRGIDQHSIQRHLGYAPQDGMACPIRRGAWFQPQMLAEVGLVKARDDGRGFYDRFRDRLMFPSAMSWGASSPWGTVVGQFA
jgi:DNA primase